MANVVLGALALLLLGVILLLTQRLKTLQERAVRAEEAAWNGAERRVRERTLGLEQNSRTLELSEARLRRLLQLLPVAVIVDSGARISFVNVAAQRLFGADEADLLGRSPQELIQADVAADARTRIASMLSGDRPAPPVEGRVRRADGSLRVVESTAALIDDRGEPAILVVLRDVTELRHAQRELLQSQADLQHLLAAQDAIQDDERRRIGRELHDDLQQTLAAIRMDLVAAGDRLATDPAAAATLLARIDALTSAAVASTRRIVNDLRPQMLEELGLLPALDAMANQFSQRSGVACRIDADPDALAILGQGTSAPATCLYRVAQEALNNVAKHAAAGTVQIRLSAAANGALSLRITDDGRGMDMDDRHGHGSLGLLGMAERVRAAGGRLGVVSQPGVGTTVEAVVPMPGAAPPSGGGLAVLAPTAPATDPVVQEVIDALAEHVAVLDPQGNILAVNRAWRAFAQRNGDPDVRGSAPGLNYLEVCRRGALTDLSVRRVLQGLRAVLAGSQPEFVSDYPCHALHEQRWFRMHVAPMVGGNVLVTHVALTPPAPFEPSDGPGR
jgi:PAS domain S-box-containing protein